MSLFVCVERGGRRKIGIVSKAEVRGEGLTLEICLPCEHDQAVHLEANVSARLRDYLRDDGSYECSLATIQQALSAAQTQEHQIQSAIWRDEDLEHAEKHLGKGTRATSTVGSAVDAFARLASHRERASFLSKPPDAQNA